MAVGVLNEAWSAGPASPPKPLEVPAKVVMIPVAASTFRIRSFPVSAMYTSPFAGSIASPIGVLRSVKSVAPVPIRSKFTEVDPAGIVRLIGETGAAVVLEGAISATLASLTESWRLTAVGAVPGSEIVKAPFRIPVKVRRPNDPTLVEISRRVSTTVTAKVPVVLRPAAEGVIVAEPGPTPTTSSPTDVCPWRIVTLAGTVPTAVLLEARLITCPPTGAAALMNTDGCSPNAAPLNVDPDVGAMVMLIAWTLTVICELEKTPEGSVAVIVALPAFLPVIVALPLVPPSAITIEAGGSAAAVFEELKLIVVPPGGAGSVSATLKGLLRPGETIVEPGSTIPIARTVTSHVVPTAKPGASPRRFATPTAEPTMAAWTELAPPGMITVAGAEMTPPGAATRLTVNPPCGAFTLLEIVTLAPRLTPRRSVDG